MTFVDIYNLEKYSFEEFKRNLLITFQPADIHHKAKQELATLEQKSMELIKEFILQFQQCLIKAQYNTGANGRFLIQLLYNAIQQELIKFVEISQIHLIDSNEFDDWVHVLIQAEQIKAEQKAWKSTSTASFDAPARSWNANPRSGSYVSPNYKGKNPITNFLVNKSSPPPPKSAAPIASHLNQSSIFDGQGAPMDISKTCTEGKCAKCSKPWSCKDHMQKCIVRWMTFCNHQISYIMANELAAEISCIKKDFPVEEQNWDQLPLLGI